MFCVVVVALVETKNRFRCGLSPRAQPSWWPVTAAWTKPHVVRGYRACTFRSESTGGWVKRWRGGLGRVAPVAGKRARLRSTGLKLWLLSAGATMPRKHGKTGGKRRRRKDTSEPKAALAQADEKEEFAIPVSCGQWWRAATGRRAHASTTTGNAKHCSRQSTAAVTTGT